MRTVKNAGGLVALALCVLVTMCVESMAWGISEAELAALRAKNPAEQAEVLVSGEITQARAAAELLVRDWDTLRINYNLVMGAVVKASGTMESGPELSLQRFFTLEPGVAEAPRSLLLLAPIPDIIREAPLGSERDAISDRFLGFLEQELANPATRLPKQVLLESLTETVFSGGSIVPERNAERVTRQLIAHVDDSDLEIRKCALQLLLRVAPSQEKDERARTLELIRARAKEAGLSASPGWQLESLERDVAGTSPWPIEVIGEREYRDMAEASTDELIGALLGKGLFKSHRALEILVRRNGTQARVLALLESHPERSEDILTAYATPLLETATEAEKQSRNQLIDFLQATLSPPVAKDVDATRLASKLASVRALSHKLDGKGFGGGFGAKRQVEPQPYARERMVGLILTALDDPDWQVRNLAADRLGRIVRGNSEIAAKIIPDLEKRAAQLEVQYGYGKESRAAEEKKLLTEFHETPKEWELYKSITFALERARNTQE